MANGRILSNLEELLVSADRILLLQGSVGHFFRNFSHWLGTRHNKLVFKINFNAGDDYNYPLNLPRTFAYRDLFDNFADYLTEFLQNHRIQAVVCFGDTRPYHLVAKEVCRQSGVPFWAFEEGYFRPHFITLEKDGVNDHSPLPREGTFFLNAYPQLCVQDYREPAVVRSGFWPPAWAAITYYLHANLKRRRYPNCVHHRDLGLSHYIRLWAQSGVKRAFYWYIDRNFAKRIEKGEFGRFFVVPLQVFNDSQVRVHSDFSSVRSFLLHVLTSFAAHAPKDTRLLIKHHPMDRGFIDYQRVINHFIKKHPDCKKRIIYVHDVPLPVFLRHGVGMVTINSTSGLSAMLHKMPVKTLGRANYDIKGLTYQGRLADFWKNPEPPDEQLFHAYRQYHMNVTHLNGSYYSTVIFPDIASDSVLSSDKQAA